MIMKMSAIIRMSVIIAFTPLLTTKNANFEANYARFKFYIGSLIHC